MCILSANTEMIIRQADCCVPVAIKLDFLVMVDEVNGQLLAMGVGFEPRTFHVGFW
jgi:hypothetical protein